MTYAAGVLGQRIWSNNPIKRLNKEIKPRADVVEIFRGETARAAQAVPGGSRLIKFG